MASNQELIEKAVIATDAISSSGKLNPAQADKFIDFVMDLTGLGQMARVVRFTNETLNIDKIGVGSRVTMPAAEGVSPSVRRGIAASQVTLTPKEIMTPFEISDTFREVNLEGDSIEDHIVKMMATQMGNDVEDLYINGDTTGAAVVENIMVPGGSGANHIKDSFMGLMDGYLRLADGGNSVDIGGQAISANTFSQMLNALPVKFRRDKSRLRFLCSPDLEQLYRERVSSRATASGDSALSQGGNLTPFGVPLVPVSLMDFYVPVVEHITLSGVDNNTQSLRYKGIQSGSVTVHLSALANTATASFIETTDFTIDYVNGTVSHVNTGAIANDAVIKVTYRAHPQMLLTHMDNLIVGLGRDIRIEKDRDIFKRVNQYAITAKCDVKFEELTAVVKGYNIGNTL